MSIPRAVLEAQKFRSEIAEEYCGYSDEYYEDDDEEFISPEGKLDLSDDADHDNTVKGRANYVLLQLYEQKGYDVFKRTCINMKGNYWFDKDEYGQFKGECAEVYLYVTILRFIEKYNLPWKVYLSLVLPNRDGIQGHTTELDVVLVSEEMITVFEAKSYNGNKTITDICTINRPAGKKDIYRQNALHCESLINQIKDYNINGPRGMKSVLFSFAQGSLKDTRDKRCSNLIPVLTEDNLLHYLSSLTRLKDKYWKPTIFDRIEELSKQLTIEDHMKFIRSSKGGRN